jgi:hypothetical protein
MGVQICTRWAAPFFRMLTGETPFAQAEAAPISDCDLITLCRTIPRRLARYSNPPATSPRHHGRHHRRDTFSRISSTYRFREHRCRCAVSRQGWPGL